MPDVPGPARSHRPPDVVGPTSYIMRWRMDSSCRSFSARSANQALNFGFERNAKRASSFGSRGDGGIRWKGTFAARVSLEVVGGEVDRGAGDREADRAGDRLEERLR